MSKRPPATTPEDGDPHDELYKRFRPRSFKGFLGNKGTKEMLEQMVQVGGLPHYMLFSGPSGTGKTTAARILASMMKCTGIDLHEMNCSLDCKGIDTVRQLVVDFRRRPICEGRCAFWILDEVQSLTKDAQSALLKELEDTPRWVYIVMCTTEPGKLQNALQTRGTHVKLELATDADIQRLLKYVSERIKFELTGPVLKAIVTAAKGSFRKAMVLLDSVRHVAAQAEQLQCIAGSDDPPLAYKLGSMLLYKYKFDAEVAKLLRDLKGVEDPEGVRLVVLAYMATTITGERTMIDKVARAALVVSEMRSPYFANGGYACLCADVAAVLTSG